MKDPVDYVDPNIGTISHLTQATTQPYVQLPHGMVRLAPITTPAIRDRYLADKVYGFPLSGSLLMATTGPTQTEPSRFASQFDHDSETATPYYYAVNLEDYDIEAEYTVTARAAYYQFAFPEGATSHLLVSMRYEGMIAVVSPNAVSGYEDIHSVRHYFYAEFSKPFASYGTWHGKELLHGASNQEGSGIGFVADYATSQGERIGVRAGVSYISVAQARQNLANEIPQWTFDEIKMQARDIWNSALGRISIKGGTEEQRTVFYTALYRSMGRMTDITENGQYYSGFDKKVHSSEGHDFYTDDGLWDTYRSLHPLQLLLEPQRQLDMVRSYLRMYEQAGWLPSFPSIGGEQAVMIGHHAAALIADTYMKGYRDFDAELAYVAMTKNAMEATMLPWRRGPLTELDRMYLDKGFFPALAQGEKEYLKEAEVDGFERRQAVSVTLEDSYDAWCLAQMANALGKNDDYIYFQKRALNYKNVFDLRIGFMAPRSGDGSFIEGFDPKLSGGQGGRDYFTEVNSWIYTFHVQHDVAGLISLLGGRERFTDKLDSLFVEQYGEAKFEFLKQFPDATGLIGNYAQGNEPSFHIPYLYNYAGAPWKTQRHLRQIMDVWYCAGPLGLCGDEDGGALSSWYVFTAMGFYPVCPGRPVYDLGSPIFEEVKITLGERKVFTIVARNVSAKNKYIQSAELNGKPLDKPWFEHAEIANGGTLVLEMGPRPNKAWGSSTDSAPPSMSR